MGYIINQGSLTFIIGGRMTTKTEEMFYGPLDQ